MSAEENEIRYTNEDSFPNTFRYTNDDRAYNDYRMPEETRTYQESDGEETYENADDSPSKVRFSSDFDAQKIASTFVVVSLVSMAVVLDDSPFGEFFDPILGEISETFGISGGDSPYSILFDLALVPTEHDFSYKLSFEEVPEGDLLMVVKQGSSTIDSTSLDTTLAGTIKNLAPGTTYTVTVLLDGEPIGASQSVTTLGTYDGTPIVKVLSAKNYNATDRDESDPQNPGGYFRFQLAVIDRNNVCSMFGAKLEFGGNHYTCSFEGSPTDEQRIFIPDSDIYALSPTGPIEGRLMVSWEVSGGEPGWLEETVYI